ncbi:MAG TPA: hypothetical protein DIS90_02735 [Cytophagales bacterium]|nr:hypothetical protein [Cytophagales bacterium]
MYLLAKRSAKLGRLGKSKGRYHDQKKDLEDFRDAMEQNGRFCNFYGFRLIELHIRKWTII